MRPLRPVRSRARLGPLLLATAVLTGCGAPVTATGGAAVSASPPGRATPTAVTVPYVPPSAAGTAGALFQLTPHPTATATAVPSPTPSRAPVAFASVQRILIGRCAGCHPPAQGLDLTAGHAYASIVDVPSREVPGLPRVKPGDPAKSYLYQKVAEARPRVGERMPRESPPLSADELTALRAWIEQGARGP